jgi:hypothetical protein
MTIALKLLNEVAGARRFRRNHPDVPQCDLDLLMSRVGIAIF